ncbi:MAG: LysM peptidoglycan-binding domain-containing M23 family metallopeptidase [Pseudomonadota bacterium]
MTEQNSTPDAACPGIAVLASASFRLAVTLFFATVLLGCPHGGSGVPPPPESSSIRPKVSAAGIYHSVAPNENLWLIARTYDINLQLLAEVNNLKPPYILQPDSKLFIPGADGTKPVAVASSGGAAPPAVQDYSGLLDWPVRGNVISDYGVRDGEFHNGISIQAGEGTPVRAAGDGKVGHVGSIPGFGNVVLIEHANRIVTVYAHLQETRTRIGTPVKRGQVIGTVGSTGRVQTPSLYFEVRSRSKPRNPLFFLPRGSADTEGSPGSGPPGRPKS